MPTTSQSNNVTISACVMINCNLIIINCVDNKRIHSRRALDKISDIIRKPTLVVIVNISSVSKHCKLMFPVCSVISWSCYIHIHVYDDVESGFPQVFY